MHFLLLEDAFPLSVTLVQNKQMKVLYFPVYLPHQSLLFEKW